MRLAPGDRFPKLEIETVEHGPMTLPDDIGTERAVVFFYRGVW